ncbi:MAG: hypothetical protein QGG54_12425 [Gammaproteobacteria bacterium]|nr:hypothetical protein [Gammaproteobacteria bacterium]MDP6651565.1 hypothetical protein [Gammaproteobacteria bacterium]
MPKTEYSYPDLQGLWTNPSQTPLQRPKALGTKQAYTTTEALELEQIARDLEQARIQPLDPDRPPPQTGGTVGAGADQNFEVRPIAISRVNGEYRTSLIVDPPDGRLPYIAGARDIYADWLAQGFDRLDGPEIRSGQERCLNSAGQVPLLYTFDATNAIDGDNPIRNIQIVQNESYVVILSEYFSAVRIIRLSDEHLDRQGSKWLGDSIARYEGDSLVIHTKNFRPEQSNFFIRSSAQLEITESYTPLSEDELLFSYTLSDPEIYSRSVTAEVPLQRMPPDHKLYEYACHEGNYSLPSILRAARVRDSQR